MIRNIAFVKNKYIGTRVPKYELAFRDKNKLIFLFGAKDKLTELRSLRPSSTQQSKKVIPSLINADTP